MGVARSLGEGDAAEHPPHPLPWGTTPVKAPKITMTGPAQQDGLGSMASIPRIRIVWGGGNSFPERVTRLEK